MYAVNMKLLLKLVATNTKLVHKLYDKLKAD